MNASPHYDRESLLSGHDAQDEMGEWGLIHAQSLALGLVDNNAHKLAQEEEARRRVLAESAEHYCHGYSFCLGPKGCGCRIDTSGMKPGEFAEMACAPNEPEPITLRERLRDLRLRLMGRWL